MTQLKTNSAQLKYTIFNPVSLDKSTDINCIWLITDNLISVWFHQATVVIQSVYGRCTLIAWCGTFLLFEASLHTCYYQCRILYGRVSFVSLTVVYFSYTVCFEGVIARFSVCKLYFKENNLRFKYIITIAIVMNPKGRNVSDQNFFLKFQSLMLICFASNYKKKI